MEWDRLVDEMTRSGIPLIPAYRASLTQAATLMADLAMAWAHIKEHGYYTVSRTGVEKMSPAVEHTAKLNEKLSRALWQLGLTPRAQQRHGTEKPDGGQPSLEDILDGDGSPGSAERMSAEDGE